MVCELRLDKAIKNVKTDLGVGVGEWRCSVWQRSSRVTTAFYVSWPMKPNAKQALVKENGLDVSGMLIKKFLQLIWFLTWSAANQTALLTEILTHSFPLCARDICEEGENHMLPPEGENNLLEITEGLGEELSMFYSRTFYIFKSINYFPHKHNLN